MKSRKGYTLLELMLVLTVLVVVAGISFSVSDLLLNSNKVTAAHDQIRAHLVKLRSRAMAEGRSYAFKVIENSGQFRMEPEEASEADANSNDVAYVAELKLEGDAIFVKRVDALARGGAGPTGTATFETEVVFHPDGTASNDTVLIFGVPGHGGRAIRIRGLTGSIQQADLNSVEAGQ